MKRAILVGGAVVSLFFVSACGSAPTPSGDGVADSSGTSSWPLRTTDPSAHPGYYDTLIVSFDANHKPIRVWQHTTPEQYARELAAHTGQPLSADATQSTRTGNVGSSSSPVVSQDDCTSTQSTWFYNYNSMYNWFGSEFCSAPSGNNQRICFDNDNPNDTGPSADDTLDISSYTFWYDAGNGYYYQFYWSGNILMVWPSARAGGNEAGGLTRRPYYTWVPCYPGSTIYCEIFNSSFSWYSSTSDCTATQNVSSSNQQYIYLL